MISINSNPALVSLSNQNVNQTSNVWNTSSVTPTKSATTTTATQPTDSVSISQQAQQAYQALNQSLVNILTPTDPNAVTMESVIASAMQSQMQPYLQIIANKANGSTTGSATDVTGATGASSPDWGSALDNLVSSGTITQGQESSIESALDADVQLGVNAAGSSSNATANTSSTTSNIQSS